MTWRIIKTTKIELTDAQVPVVAETAIDFVNKVHQKLKKRSTAPQAICISTTTAASSYHLK